MDGLDLGGIMSMLQPMLPTLSYILNLLTKAFDIFTSYLGFDLSTPPETEEESSSEEVTTL